MKFSLNGALLLCTMDGSNVEIANEVGLENVYFSRHLITRSFTFGPSYQEYLKQSSSPSAIPESLQTTFNYLEKGEMITPEEAFFIIQPLKSGDYFGICKDFMDYCRIQKEMESLWKNQNEWTRRSILTVAGMGKFSSDNAYFRWLHVNSRIAKYCQMIWEVNPLPEQENNAQMKRTRSFPRINSVQFNYYH